MGQDERRILAVGFACTELIARPQQWINRRVETIEILSHEETRRRVSIDFTLSDEEMKLLTADEGVVVPISVLTKEPRRNFDLRDEGGRAVPVLGKEQNGRLAQSALISAAFSAVRNELAEQPSGDLLGGIAADLSRVVMAPPEEARDALGNLHDSAARGDLLRKAIIEDATCKSLLDVLWANYVLFAVLPVGGPNRRILKYSYGEGAFEPPRDALNPARLVRRVWWPNRRQFVIECPMAWRGASFHAEVAIPEDLRVEFAAVWDFRRGQMIGEAEENVDRAALYASGLTEEHHPAVYAVVAPERAGFVSQAALTGVTVAGLLWLGVASGLDASAPGASVSIVTAGAALFSGIAAVQGEHRLVKRIFAASRRWLTLVSLTALAASALLAMEFPCAEPVREWRIAAIVASVAALCLVWTYFRAPGYR